MHELPPASTGGRSRYKGQVYITLAERGQTALTSPLYPMTADSAPRVAASLQEGTRSGKNTVSTKTSPVLIYMYGNFRRNWFTGGV